MVGEGRGGEGRGGHIQIVASGSNYYYSYYLIFFPFQLKKISPPTIYGVAPQYLLDLIKINDSSGYQLRSHQGILLMDNTYRTKETLGDRVFENVAPKVWSQLPLEIRQCQSLNTFKVLLKTHLFKLAF